MPIFGLSSGSLTPYLTSEKDVIRNVTRMPTMDYLIRKIADENAGALEDEFEMPEANPDDDWVLIFHDE